MNKDQNISYTQDQERKRFTLLEFIWEETRVGGGLLSPKDISLGIGMNQDELFEVLEYLDAEGLTETKYYMGHDFVTRVAHKGKIEMESACNNPTKDTSHFQSSVITNFYEVKNMVQIGGDNLGIVGDQNTQFVKGSISKIIQQLQASESSNDRELAEYLEQLRAELERPDTGLSDSDRKRALKHVDALAKLSTDKENLDFLEKAEDAIAILPTIMEKGSGLVEFAQKHFPTISKGISLFLGLPS